MARLARCRPLIVSGSHASAVSLDVEVDILRILNLQLHTHVGHLRTNMDPPPPKVKPALKLKFGSQNGAVNPLSQPPTPSSQTPVRTPSLKLSFGKKPTSSTPATPNEDGTTPNGSAKKRKRTESIAESDGKPELKRAPTLLKLFTKNNPMTTKSTAPTPGIKLKTKGKIPRRPQGVGYDSELEDREMDPVLLEGLVIRMQPGEDCEYIRSSINNGTVGVSILQNGADIRLRFLDVNGRRGILTVRGRQYAFTVVDLPTITEAMKSWDKKNFIKSIDISQLLLVLGRCSTDEEARNFPLPADVNPRNYKYAHGLTAPMRNVRKRRFERTARARLDDIEAVERKVAQILEADDRASEVKYEVLSYDPRQEEYSDSESDAEGEEEEDYFAGQNGDEADGQEHTAEDMAELEAMLMEQDDNAPDTGTTTTQPATDVASSAPSPMPADEAPTPAADADADDDGDDDDEDENAEASDQEASDEREENLAKIRETEEKIAQQKEQLRKTTNGILRKKIAKKIQALESDVKMMKRHAGIKDDDGEGDDDGQETVNVPAKVAQREDSGSEEE